jgi:hypothetical protein
MAGMEMVFVVQLLVVGFPATTAAMGGRAG